MTNLNLQVRYYQGAGFDNILSKDTGMLCIHVNIKGIEIFGLETNLEQGLPGYLTILRF